MSPLHRIGSSQRGGAAGGGAVGAAAGGAAPASSKRVLKYDSYDTAVMLIPFVVWSALVITIYAVAVASMSHVVSEVAIHSVVNFMVSERAGTGVGARWVLGACVWSIPTLRMQRMLCMDARACSRMHVCHVCMRLGSPLLLVAGVGSC